MSRGRAADAIQRCWWLRRWHAGSVSRARKLLLSEAPLRDGAASMHLFVVQFQACVVRERGRKHVAAARATPRGNYDESESQRARTRACERHPHRSRGSSREKEETKQRARSEAVRWDTDVFRAQSHEVASRRRSGDAEAAGRPPMVYAWGRGESHRYSTVSSSTLPSS